MKKIAFLLLTILSLQHAKAQQKDSIALITHVGADNVQLKWLPSTYDLWQEGVQSGYLIERYETQKTEGKWKFIKKEILTPDALKPWSDERITKEAETTPELNSAKVLIAGRILEMTQPSQTDGKQVFELQNQRQYMHMLSLLGVVTNNKTAEALGLYYVDKTVLPGKTYLYKVILNNKAKNKAETVVNMNQPTKLPAVIGFDYEIEDKAVELFWPHPPHRGYFAYNIYRSTSKGGTYTQLNKRPYLGEIAIREDDNRMKYLDSFPQMNKTYYYKIKGINAFEETSAFSEVLTVKAVQYIKQQPFITAAFSKDNKMVELQWNITEEDKQAVQSFSVWTSVSVDAVMTKLNAKPIEATTYSYKDIRPDKPAFNYYKVCSYGVNGDSICTLHKEVFLVDSIPAEPPVIVVAVSDTNGIVTLNWKKGKEADILGYRIFRTYYTHKEPDRITYDLIEDTVFVDTIGLRSGFKKVYYGISTIDQVYNASRLSRYVEVTLPDKTPPTNALLNSYTAGYSGIQLDWTPSVSKDVKYQYVLRKSEYEFQWRPILKLSGDSLKIKSFTDTLTQSNVWYEYKLLAEDSAGLKATDIQVFRVLQPEKDPFPVVSNIRGVASRDNKMIKLSWDFDKQATGFKIMRSVKGKNVETYEFVAGSKREFYDTWLVPNTEYSYAIIAELPGGRRSLMSKVIKISY